VRRSLSRDRSAPPPLRLHHTGILVREIEPAAARYVRRMGYWLRTEKLHDPVQTAYVQFLALPGERTLLELVAPDGPQSRLANAASKGGGLHHLCYATPDIEASCGDWRASGFFLIRDPTPAVAFRGRRIAWLMSPEHVLLELVEQGREGEL
jgi:catechol 2,3-dioxygenase-like lactoylglutathione lyase family enzyme